MIPARAGRTHPEKACGDYSCSLSRSPRWRSPALLSARGGDYGFEGGTPAQRSQVRAALGASNFDWSAVPTRVTIHIQPDIPTQATPGHIWLDARLVSSGRFAWAAIQDEYAHQVDFSRFDATTRERLTGQL